MQYQLIILEYKNTYVWKIVFRTVSTFKLSELRILLTLKLNHLKQFRGAIAGPALRCWDVDRRMVKILALPYDFVTIRNSNIFTCSLIDSKTCLKVRANFNSFDKSERELIWIWVFATFNLGATFSTFLLLTHYANEIFWIN